MPSKGPATDFKLAYNQMELPLDNPVDFEAFYVERQHRCVDELIAALRASDGFMRVLYSGYPRSGKSTELFRLMRELEGDFLPVYISADESFERSDIKHIDVLFAMCMQLAKVGEDHGLTIDPLIAQRMEGWVDQVEGAVEQIRSEESTREAGAGISLSWIVKIMARFKVEHQTREEIRKTLEPRGSELVDTMDELATAYYAELDTRPLLIVDDLEKSDSEIAESIFVGHSSSMRSVRCDVIYTIPVSLINTEVMQALRRVYDDDVVLPMIAVRDREGNRDSAGAQKVASIVTKRVSADLFEGEALEQIALNSGGVIADALRLARDCCLTAMTEGAEKVTEEMVAEHAGEMVLSYKRGLAEKYYDKLRVVALERSSEVDEDHGELMDALAILEYENNPNWYDVHPAVRRLLELRGDISPRG